MYLFMNICLDLCQLLNYIQLADLCILFLLCKKFPSFPLGLKVTQRSALPQSPLSLP